MSKLWNLTWILLVVTLSSCNGEAPTIISFHVLPTKYCAPLESTAVWETRNADTVRIETNPSISPNPLTGLSASGQTDFSIEQDTVFTLVAKNSDGERNSNVSVEMIPEEGDPFKITAPTVCENNNISSEPVDVIAGYFDARASVVSVINITNHDLVVEHSGTTVTIEQNEITSQLNGDPHGIWRLSIAGVVPRCENAPANLEIEINIKCN